MYKLDVIKKPFVFLDAHGMNSVRNTPDIPVSDHISLKNITQLVPLHICELFLNSVVQCSSTDCLHGYVVDIFELLPILVEPPCMLVVLSQLLSCCYEHVIDALSSGWFLQAQETQVLRVVLQIYFWGNYRWHITLQ